MTKRKEIINQINKGEVIYILPSQARQLLEYEGLNRGGKISSPFVRYTDVLTDVLVVSTGGSSFKLNYSLEKVAEIIV